MKLVLLLLLQISTAPHQAVLYFQSTACTVSTPCLLQMFRASCSSPTTCPPWGNGHGWQRISPKITTNVSASGTQWVVVDSLKQDGATYVYAATNIWMAGGSLSAPSPLWQGTTSLPSAGIPPPPTLGTNNSVN
jgi:hypothetical protein